MSIRLNTLHQLILSNKKKKNYYTLIHITIFIQQNIQVQLVIQQTLYLIIQMKEPNQWLTWRNCRYIT